MHERLLGLIVVQVDIGKRIGIGTVGDLLLGILALDQEMIAADIEVVSVAQPGEIDGGDQVPCGRAGECGSRD